MRIYLAGPYSAEPEQCTHEAIRIANELRNMGHSPFVPHLTHYWHLRHPRAYEDWLDYDLDWLEVCNVLIRIPGHSPGADREVEAARRLGLTVMTWDQFRESHSPKGKK